jgi:hypothetical protein
LIERLREFLAAADEIALQHRADDGLLPGGTLAHDLAEDIWHAAVVLGAVAVAGVDHDRGFQLRGFEAVDGLHDIVRAVVGAAFTAAQDDVAVGIAAGGHGGGHAVLVHAEEGLRLHRGLDRVDGGHDVPKGAVLEPERHREAGGHLAMRLRFRRARTDGAPRDQIGDVLRRDGIQQLRGRGQAEIEHITQDAPRQAQAVGDVAGAVEVRVHDEPLPADGGARLFEIDAHDEAEPVLQFLRQRCELPRILQTGLGIMNRARAEHDEETRIFAEQDVADLTP